MGLIKNIFGAIFGLIGGLLGAITGVFKKGKKSEFFLELDEAASDAQQAILETASNAVDKVLPAKSEKAAAAKPAVAEAPAPAKPAPVKPAVPVGNFATDYLVTPNASSRRRPGPSLSPFRDLARQVKVPAK